MSLYLLCQLTICCPVSKKKNEKWIRLIIFQVTEIGLSKATLAIIPQKVIHCIFLLIVVQTEGCTC